MALDMQKFKDLIHYVCWRCGDDPSKLGSVKLNKILWLADFSSFYRYGEPITGSRYIKRQYGPVPSQVKPAIRELEMAGILEVSSAPFFKYSKNNFICRREPANALLTSEELEIIDKAITYVTQEHTAKSISDLSHDHIWQAAQDGEEIPYFTIFAQPAAITADELEWANHQLESPDDATM